MLNDEGPYLRTVRKNLTGLGRRATDNEFVYAGLLAEAVLILAAIADELHEMNERKDKNA